MRFLLQASCVLFERPQNRMHFLFHPSFLGPAPGTNNSGNLLPRACPKNFGSFMTASMPTEKFGKLYYRELVPLELPKFPKF